MLKQRHSIRLKKYDYSKSGLYFVTICTQNRKCLFGNMVNGEMVLNEFGKIVDDIWKSLPDHHPVELDTFQIMPNHIHFIIQIINMGGLQSTFKPTLGFIVGMLKTESTKQINQYSVGARRDAPLRHKIWQRNYYEHIIRNEIELMKIREYIINNPLMWDKDRNNPQI